jgi:hypothetical protein
MTQLTRNQRDQIVGEVREYMKRRFRGPDLAASCLYWAFATVGILHAHGIKASLQAGTMSWPLARPEEKNPDFIYQWNPHSTITKQALKSGYMPEMHAWAGIQPTREEPEGEIVDLTTCYLPEQRKKIIDACWPKEFLPPDYFWSAELPRRVVYAPDPGAIYVASEMLRQTVQYAFGFGSGAPLRVRLAELRV